LERITALNETITWLLQRRGSLIVEAAWQTVNSRTGEDKGIRIKHIRFQRTRFNRPEICLITFLRESWLGYG
jgi:hypothetical protein